MVDDHRLEITLKSSIDAKRSVTVAVLLSTYNAGPYIDPQIRSLKHNATPFTLHWIDDHSTDGTREAVSALAKSAGIQLKEWHHSQHLGVPNAFFQLLECVEADIYLFCDQDDIWQPGKIDATVKALLPDINSPVLCFSEPLAFNDGEPEILRNLSDLWPSLANLLQESRMFMPICIPGHTHGFTRPLQEIFLKHKGIARTYAFMHDWWLYNIATASGTVRFVCNVPTTLYRRHQNNFTAGPGHLSGSWVTNTWNAHQAARRIMAKNAHGFVLAKPTMTPGSKLERFFEIARIISTIDQRQSPATLARLAWRGALWRNWYEAAWLIAVCLCSNANTAR